MNTRYAKTEWGIGVKAFAARYGITMKDIAKGGGVSYNTFLQVTIGKTPGKDAEVVKKVDAYMKDYASKHDPAVRRALQSVEEA